MKELTLVEVLHLVFRTYPPDGYLRVGNDYYLAWNFRNSGVWVACPRDLSHVYLLDEETRGQVREVGSWWQNPETNMVEPLMGWEEQHGEGEGTKTGNTIRGPVASQH